VAGEDLPDRAASCSAEHAGEDLSDSSKVVAPRTEFYVTCGGIIMTCDDRLSN
jgi:hypothetical protein